MYAEFVDNGQITEAGYDAWGVLAKGKSDGENISLVCDVTNIHPAAAGVHVFLSVILHQNTRFKTHMFVPDVKCEKIFGYNFSKIRNPKIIENICADLVGCVVEWRPTEHGIELSTKRKLRSLADIFDRWQPGDAVLSL